MSYHFPLPSPSPLLVSPREPISTGVCSECEEDFTDRVFTYTAWPEKARIVCSWCAQSIVIKRLQQAQSDGDEDVLEILQSVDEIARCKDCGRFVCECQ